MSGGVGEERRTWSPTRSSAALSAQQASIPGGPGVAWSAGPQLSRASRGHGARLRATAARNRLRAIGDSRATSFAGLQ